MPRLDTSCRAPRPTLRGILVPSPDGGDPRFFPWSRISQDQGACWPTDGEGARLPDGQRLMFCDSRVQRVARRAQARWIARTFRNRTITLTVQCKRIPWALVYVLGVGMLLGPPAVFAYRLATRPIHLFWEPLPFETKIGSMLSLVGLYVTMLAPMGIAYLLIARGHRKAIPIRAIRAQGDRIVLLRRDGGIEVRHWTEVVRIGRFGRMFFRDGNSVWVVAQSRTWLQLLEVARKALFPSDHARSERRKAGMPRRLVIGGVVAAVVAVLLLRRFPNPDLDSPRLASWLIGAAVFAFPTLMALALSKSGKRLQRFDRRLARRRHRKRREKRGSM